jgi:glycosyltransferase involved in cell wall biosynthesis
MDSPLLSVVVPNRDQAPFIDVAMQSLLRQFADPSVMEVLLVDDGSVDGSGDMAERYMDRLPGLRILRNETAMGVASARNSGLAHSTGRYVTFLDPDDWYAPGHLARLVQDIQELGVDFVRVDHIRHERGVRSIHRVPQALRNVALNPRDGIGPYNKSTVVDYCFPPFGIFDGRLRDEGMLDFIPGRHTAEDRPWVWRLHLKCTSYAVSPQLGAFYRRGVSQSLTQVFDRRQLDFIPCFQEVFRLVAEDPEAERFWDKAVRQFLAISSHHLNRSSQMDAAFRAELHAGIASSLALLPEHVKARGLELLDPKRRALVNTALRSTQ